MVNRPHDLGVIADTYIAAILGRTIPECKKVFDDLIQDLSIVSSEIHIASKIVKAKPLELAPEDANPKRKATE
jgi:hypothetical protein